MSVYAPVGGTQAVVPPADNGTKGFVTSGFTSANLYASTAMQSAMTFLGQLGAAGNSLRMPSLPPAAPSLPTLPATFAKPVAPSSIVGYFTLPAVPEEPALGAIAPLDVPSAPEFSAVPLPLVIPAAPDPFAGSVPVAPTLPDVAMPASPTLVLPDVPTMLGIAIPGAPVLNLPSFAATLAASPDAPANSFAFTESAYTSDLLDSLRTRLQDWIDGDATGLAPAVEQALWERGRARENALLARKMSLAVKSFAQRGFAKPPGALALALADAAQETQGTLSALSRDIMIKQAELEQSNRHFAFETAFKVEAELITYQNLIAQRGFETAKYAQQVAIDIFHELVLRYQADTVAYQTEANVFKTLIEAELAKLDVYKSELEGQKLIGELNVQAVQIYQSRVSAGLAQVELFKVQVQAATAMLESNKVRIEGFAATVSAFDSTVRAKAAEYQGYATAVQAESVKTDIFKSQAEAFRSQAEAFRSTVEAAVAQKNSDIEVNRKLPLELFRVRTEVFRSRTDAEAARMNTALKAADTNAQVYDSQVRAEAAKSGADTERFRSQTDSAIAAAQLQLGWAKETVQLAIQQAAILTEAIKAGSQVSAQIAAAALSSVNLSAQLSDHNSNSASNSASNSRTDQASSQIGDITHHNVSSREGE
jgi:hypothetical protein